MNKLTKEDLAIQITYAQAKEINISVDDWVKKIEELLEAQNQDLLKKIEGKKWTFIEGNIEMTEKAKKAIIRIHNEALEDIKKLIEI